MPDTPDAGTEASHSLAPIIVRRDAEIYATDGGWFRARWHFSFDRYHDPENMGVGQLRVFNHDTLVPGAVWPMHPHRDIEGITYVVSGEFEHSDSAGNGGVLYPGAVQRVTLGSGLMHSEMNHSQTEEMQFIQMWIMPSRRGLEPSIEQMQYSQDDRHNRLLRILRPEASDGGDGVAVHQDASMFVARMDPGLGLSHQVPRGHVAYLYLIAGELDLINARLRGGDAAKVIADGRLELHAAASSEVLLVDTTL
jgi:redox-sensitive bicupin YhaK (pirin superfamily)